MSQVSHYCFGDTCYVCHPTLFQPSSFGKVPYRCPVCEGRGVVRQNFYTMAESSTDVTNVPCRSCINGIIYV